MLGKFRYAFGDVVFVSILFGEVGFVSVCVRRGRLIVGTC